MPKLTKPARVRYAPSPTGYAHLGFVSRVMINYAMARQSGGQFIWRNEDTDQERFIPDALEFNMKWVREFGLDWDEGPDIGGPYAPYTQTERLPSYHKHCQNLIDKGAAYRCFCTRERLAELRQVQELTKQQTRYDGNCRNLSAEEIKQNLDAGKSFTVRIKVPKDTKFEFDDAITHNHVVWDSNEIDDAIIMKSDGIPTYHLAAMCDDVDMKITHILRGSEWLASTPIHLFVLNNLGATPENMPLIGHFTVILDPDTPGKKFSKRNSNFRVNGLLQKGYLRPAILNYLMLLGWAPKDNRELFTLEEFVEAFDLEGMQKANPAWNQQKMDWFNGVYLRQLNLVELTTVFKHWIESYLLTSTAEEREIVFIQKEGISIDRLADLLEFAAELLAVAEPDLSAQLALVQERGVHMWQMLQQLYFFYHRVTPNWEIKQLDKVRDKLAELQTAIKEFMESLPDDTKTWTHEEWEAGLRAIGDKYEVKHGDIFMVLRVAIVGEPFSPPLFECLQLLGKAEVMGRL